MNNTQKSKPHSDESKIRVYLAGPMTGLPEFNAPEFMKAAQRLESEGFEVFNPAAHDMDAGFNPFGCSGHEAKDKLAEMGFDLRHALAVDLDWIARNAEIVAVLKGWETSKGVAAEIALADALGIPVADADSLTLDPGDGDFSGVDYTLLRKTERKNPTPTMTYGLEYLKTNTEGLIGFANVADPTAPKLSELNKGLKESAKLMDGGAKLTVSETGGQKGSKEARYDLIPVKPLETLARLYGKGAEKYDDNNWAKGYDWKFSYAAMQRHANQFWAGEDNDPEMGLPHLASVAWHAFTMMYFMENHPQYDSRMKTPPTS